MQKTFKCIAILGFGRSCSDQNRKLAIQAGRELAERGIVIAAGNVTGTFYYAFAGAKSAAGRTLAIVEKNIDVSNNQFCDEIKTVEDTVTKHRLIAELCMGAIVIGGGEGTSKVIDRLLGLGKLVVAIKDSGGIVESGLDKRVRFESDLKKAVEIILKSQRI